MQGNKSPILYIIHFFFFLVTDRQKVPPVTLPVCSPTKFMMGFQKHFLHFLEGCDFPSGKLHLVPLNQYCSLRQTSPVTLSAMKQCIWDKPAVYQAQRAAFVFSPSAMKQCIWKELRCIRLTEQHWALSICNETMYLSGKSWRCIRLISRGHHCAKGPPSFFFFLNILAHINYTQQRVLL